MRSFDDDFLLEPNIQKQREEWNMNLKNETGAAMAASRSAYEAKVGVEAVLRSGGKNPQLKGVVHEILYRDCLLYTSSAA